MSETIKANLSDDSFIHFTYKSRAEEIINSGKLLTNPVHKKFGIAGNQAISVNYGQYVPTVQVTHLQPAPDDDPIVAVWFKTRTMPRVGYPEEVIWDGDVELINPKKIPMAYAIKILGERDPDNDFTLLYESLIIELSSDENEAMWKALRESGIIVCRGKDRKNKD
jgi:hypothetical protein